MLQLELERHVHLPRLPLNGQAHLPTSIDESSENHVCCIADQPGRAGLGEFEHGSRTGGQTRGGRAKERKRTALLPNERFDQMRKGMRLMMTYDAVRNSFSATVENMTGKTIERVRVEVHLSNGKDSARLHALI